jgi:hypothetical protein
LLEFRAMTGGLATWVYRDGRRQRNGRAILASLARLVRAIPGPERTCDGVSATADALVACGELEAALGDAGHISAASVAIETDHLAAATLGEPFDSRTRAAHIERIDVPPTLVTSTQEGCAYYALSPSSYARAIDDFGPCDKVLVIGIRTIGATLSATVMAAVRARGVGATRCTVRPGGHPYARVLDLEPSVSAQIERARADGALVAIVDEGPGLSGSTFLAVAERVARAGIPDRRIVIVASSAFDASKLAAVDAASRYARFRVVVAPVQDETPIEGISVSGGAWRAFAFDDEASWPSVFARAERRKILVDAASRLLKFEGIGATGRAAIERWSSAGCRGLRRAGRDEGAGYLSYAWGGRPCVAAQVDAALLERLACYCAARPLLCPAFLFRSDGHRVGPRRRHGRVEPVGRSMRQAARSVFGPIQRRRATTHRCMGDRLHDVSRRLDDARARPMRPSERAPATRA